MFYRRKSRRTLTINTENLPFFEPQKKIHTVSFQLPCFLLSVADKSERSRHTIGGIIGGTLGGLFVGSIGTLAVLFLVRRCSSKNFFPKTVIAAGDIMIYNCGKFKHITIQDVLAY